jgi:hypothetical protein
MPRWTPESRERQRQLINRVRPWESSTGPTSSHGKSQSARNGPNHGARAPGTHPRELRQYRARLWRLWKLRLSLVSLAGIFDPETTRSLADQIASTEASLGIPRAETEARLTRSLLRLAQRRVSR